MQVSGGVEAATCGGVGVAAREGRSSFLKKRSKRLLFLGV
jgi:hypothetical protein